MIKSTVHVLSLSAVIATMFLLTGCLTAPFVPPTGTAYSQFNAPLDVDFQNTDLTGMKQGKASTVCILGLVAWGDVSSKAAADAANISTIAHADYEYFNVLGIYQKTTVVVYGK